MWKYSCILLGKVLKWWRISFWISGLGYQLDFKALSFFLNSFKLSILSSYCSVIAIGKTPSSDSNATVGVDLNDLRMRDIAPLCVDSSSFRLLQDDPMISWLLFKCIQCVIWMWISTTMPKIFFSLTCFITEPFTVISILELFLFLFSNRITCVFCLFMFILHFSHHLAESAEILPEKNKNSTGLSMDSWGSPKSLSNHPLI